MIELGDIFRRYGAEYLKKFSPQMLPSHSSAINAISKCRTGELGCHIDTCKQCGHTHLFFHSCYNRSCPKCHAGNTQKWFEKKKSNLLPTPYFHVVFTLPAELRFLVRSHQTPSFNCLFKAASYALFKLMADSRFAGGTPGMMGVLHTCTRVMNYHPHVHFLVPAGVISRDGSQWQWIPIKKKEFLFPIHMLSTIFRARFMKLARKALPGIDFPQSLWTKQWVVYTKPFKKGGQKILQYLARYIYRIAITNDRILADHNGTIAFKYQCSSNGKSKKMMLPAFEFMRRFLQHVLPGGCHKVRCFGFLTPKYKNVVDSLRLRLETSTGNTTSKSEQSESDTGKYYRRCPKCKTGIMVVVIHLFPTKKGILLVRPPPCKK